MSDLPPGWEWATLGTLLQVQYGKSLPQTARSDDAPFPVVASAGVMAFTTEPLTRGPTIVIGRKGNVGSIQVFDHDSWPIDTVFYAAVPAGMEPRFLGYQLQHLRLSQYDSSTSTPSLRREDLESVRMAVPPIVEQCRIVAVLENHLSRLHAGKAALRSAQQRAVCASRSYLQKMLESLKPDRTLGSVLREPLRNGYSGRASQDGTGVRTLTLTAVTRAEFSDEYTKIAKVNGRKVDDLWLEPGDLLVQRSNTPELVGTSALYNGPRNWAIFPDLLIRVRTNREILPGYAQLVLSSPKVHRVLRESAKGLAGSMPKIDQGTLGGLLIPVPSIEVQERIVRLAEEFNRKIMRLRTKLTIVQIHGESLCRSLLADAFSGCLIPHNPDDEPASALLERIRAERVAQPKSKRTRRTRQSDTTQEALL